MGDWEVDNALANDEVEVRDEVEEDRDGEAEGVGDEEPAEIPNKYKVWDD